MSKSNDLQYGAQKHEYGMYTFTNVPPDSNQSSITINSSGANEVIFSIPSNRPFNPSRSILSYVNTPVAGGGGVYNWQWMHTVPEWQTVQVYDSNGRFYQNSDAINYRTVVELPLKTRVQDLKSAGKAYGGIECWTGLRNINGLVGNTQDESFGKYADGVSMVSNIDEKMECTPGTVNAATPVITRQFELRKFGGFLACDRIVCFPTQIYIKLMSAPVTEVYFTSVSATDPTSTPGVGTSVALSSIALDLAVVNDPDIYMQTLSKMKTSGIDILFDYPLTARQSGSGETQNYSNTLTTGCGYKLKYILFTAIPSSTRTKNKAYNRNNISQAILSQVQTLIDSEPQQKIPVTCGRTGVSGKYNDYNHLQKILSKSCNQSMFEYEHGWFFGDIFFDFTNDDPTAVCNFSVKPGMKYEIQTTSVDVDNIWYVFYTFQRHMHIGKDSVLIDGF